MLSLVVRATLLAVIAFSAFGAAQSEPSREAAPEVLPREFQNLRTQLQAAQEQITKLEDSLKFEREVNDELMRGRQNEQQDALAQKLDSASREFDRVLSELKGISNH